MPCRRPCSPGARRAVVDHALRILTPGGHRRLRRRGDRRGAAGHRPTGLATALERQARVARQAAHDSARCSSRRGPPLRPTDRAAAPAPPRGLTGRRPKIEESGAQTSVARSPAAPGGPELLAGGAPARREARPRGARRPAGGASTRRRCLTSTGAAARLHGARAEGGYDLRVRARPAVQRAHRRRESAIIDVHGTDPTGRVPARPARPGPVAHRSRRRTTGGGTPAGGPGGGAASWRDRLILTLLASGASDAVIARQSGVSQRTVERRVRALMDRLGAATRFQAGVQASAAAGSETPAPRRLARRPSPRGERRTCPGVGLDSCIRAPQRRAPEPVFLHARSRRSSDRFGPADRRAPATPGRRRARDRRRAGPRRPGLRGAGQGRRPRRLRRGRRPRPRPHRPRRRRPRRGAHRAVRARRPGVPRRPAPQRPRDASTRAWSSAASTSTTRRADGDGAAEREVRYIGRLGVRDDDYEPLVIDWRAPAAAAVLPGHPGRADGRAAPPRAALQGRRRRRRSRTTSWSPRRPTTSSSSATAR